MLSVKVMNVASNKKSCPSFNQVKESIETKRTAVEQGRNGSLRRIHQDLQRIAKREQEYGKRLLEELVPVKVSWNEEAFQKLKEFVPIQVEYKKEEEEEDFVEPEVVSSEKDDI